MYQRKRNVGLVKELVIKSNDVENNMLVMLVLLNHVIMYVLLVMVQEFGKNPIII